MIWILLLTQAIAQNPDSQLIKKVEEKFGDPPRYGSEARENKPRYPLPDQGPEMEEILSSPIIQKTVVKGGSIYDLKEEKSYGASSSMIIDVHQKTDHYGYFYIVGFSGEITKRIHMRHALDIKADIEMYEAPKTYSEVKERKNVSPFDKDFTHRPEATVAYGLSSSPWIADILDDSKANQGQGYRLGGRWLVDLAGKFQLGGVVNFEASNYLMRTGSARYRNISFGVAGKTNTLDWGGFASRFLGEI
ncbi:MAG: hypothetical protein K2P81_13855, partial [Bacteriovoracaceae bacterium]|nr:hypothetical protein [Bacteriovoracaceae bacterium]